MKIAILIYDGFTALDAIGPTEYDPQPPFDSGSISKADPEIVEFAKKGADQAFQ